MPQMTFPNQRSVCVHRERATANFLGIKNENWQAASRDLGAHALQLYLYLASNANNYTVALSPVAVRQAIGMARSTYHDQFHKLIDKGYLVPSHGNTFDFYEIPKTDTQPQKLCTDDGLDFEESSSRGNTVELDGHTVSPENIEINNREDTPNTERINNSADEEKGGVQKPEVKEITIPRPVAEGRNRPEYSPKTKKAVFVF